MTQIQVALAGKSTVSVFSSIHVHYAMMLQTTLPIAFMTAAVFLSAAGGSRVHAERPAPDREVLVGEMTAALSVAVTPRDSVPLYTEEQATAGEAVFAKVCVECHEKSDVTSADFRAKWHGQTLNALYELVRTTMPDSNPGALSRDEYATSLAYILKLNGVPSGPTAIMPDSTAMQAITLSLPPK